MTFISEATALVVGSAVIAYICQRLRILPIVGFLLAGLVIGPGGLALVHSEELIDLAAEIGVVLLLFTLGIEFSLDRMKRIQRAIFIGGSVQMVLTIAAVAILLQFFGVGWRAGLFTGSLVALSSTAIVLKVLTERFETSAQKGQLAVGILIFQDLAVVALVLIVPMLAGGGGSPLLLVQKVALAVGIIVAVILVARRVMPPVLEMVARTCSQEIFLLTIIAICFGTAWLTNLAGVSISLGAFLGGLVVSESRFSHQAFAEILPLQILFSAVFFVSVGLLLDLKFLVAHPLLVGTVVVAVVVLKSIATFISAMVLRYSAAIGASVALLLAQIGEFSFVLERVGRDHHLYPAASADLGGQTFIAAAVLLMMITPLLAKAGQAFTVEDRRPRLSVEEETERLSEEGQTRRLSSTSEPAADLENHVIVAGYGSAARYLTRVLRDSGIPFIIVTLSPTGAAEAERDGMRVMIGDYTKRVLLDRASIERAKMLVVPDDRADVAERVSAIARGINPTLVIVARTASNVDVEQLMAAGADQVLVDEMEVGVQLFTRVLSEYKVTLPEIDDHVATVRANGYAALRSGIAEGPLVVCEDLSDACFDTRTFTVRAPSVAARMLREEGITVTSVRRSGQEIGEIGDDFLFEPGDRVTARGAAESFTRIAPRLLSPSPFRLAPSSTPERVVALTEEQRTRCAHAGSVRAEVITAAAGCEECLRTGDTWVHLRICMSCGGVRCCDSSKNRHATRHFESTDHPVIRSYQPGETWAWCYPDRLTF